MIDHNSTSELRTYLESHGLRLKKRFGQNFLVDQSVRERIAELAQQTVRPGDVLWEIGPGLGSLTQALVDRGMSPVLFEIDHGLVRALRDQFSDSIEIIVGDFVHILQEGVSTAPSLVVGNLPYASASAMIARIIEQEVLPAHMVFLVQTEFARRLQAAPGEKDYAAITVLAQSHYEVSRAFDVHTAAFFPRPRVESCVIVMERRADVPSSELRKATSDIARAAFSQRRKTLRNSLKPFTAHMKRAGIDDSLRPERLGFAAFQAIARELLAATGANGHGSEDSKPAQ